MKLKVFSMYDNKVDVFNRPMFLQEEKELREMLKSVEQMEEINPKDYDVYELGEYDTTTGKFDMLEGPKHLYSVGQMVNMNNKSVLHKEKEQDPNKKVDNKSEKGEENGK